MTPNCVAIALMVLLGTTVAQAQTTRIASDFEIQQMEKQAAGEHEFTAQFAAHLNLGDSRKSRNESSVAIAEYRRAADIAQAERASAWKIPDMKRYAIATTCLALADAKLNDGTTAFELLEEALRYSSDDAKTWNFYASSMTILGKFAKAASASRNAIAIAEAELQSSPSLSKRIELAVDQLSLAEGLFVIRQDAEAQPLLEQIVTSLRQKEFDPLRKAVARSESFEVYSTTRTDAAAYLTVLNRSQLRLAEICEDRGEIAKARKVYEDVLSERTDDPTALAALARLLRSASDRAQAYADAFDANPFSIALIREYETWLRTNSTKPNDEVTDGALVRRVLEQRAAGENVAAGETLEILAAKFPQNDVVQYLEARNDIDLGDLSRARTRTIGLDELRRDIEDRLGATAAPAPAFLSGAATVVAPSTEALRQLMAFVEQQRITPEQRVILDKLKFTSSAIFDSAKGDEAARTILESGSIDGIPFRFSEPIAFAGAFAAKTPLAMTYRFLGVTDLNGANALLVEPLRLEVPR